MADEIVAAAEILQGAVDERAASAIEQAQQQTADAQALAQQLTDAALQTELGRQVSALREENLTWRNSMESRLTTQDQTLSEIRTRLETPPVVLAPSSLIPEQLAETPGVAASMPPEIQPIHPDENGDGHAEAGAPEPEPEAGRRIAKRRII